MDFFSNNPPQIVFPFRFFAFCVWIHHQKLHRAEFLPVENLSFCCAENLFTKEVAKHLKNYFFEQKPLPLLPMEEVGLNPFQKKLREVLIRIPFGKTSTYQELAQTLKSSAQGVGQSLKVNPLPLFVPCHRVVGKKNLGGFHGQRENFFVRVKQSLLENENAR